jgi:hypothetical protein
MTRVAIVLAAIIATTIMPAYADQAKYHLKLGAMRAAFRTLSVFKWFGTICSFWNGGSGAFGFGIRRLSTDVAIVAV